MINLRCPSRIEIDDIVLIIGEKYNPHKTTLLGLKTKILERYSKYIELELNGRIKPIKFSINEKNALASLYSSRTKTAKLLFDEVINVLNPNHSDCCLYCGIGEIDQIDHYLPQEHFPEFSILHKNLIPICGTCNEIKGSNIPGINGKDYLHLIYDILPIENIFDCAISFIDKVPSISYTILPKFKNSVLNTHFSELRLKERIEKKSVQYCLQIKALKEQFGSPYAKEELTRDFNKLSAFFGIYYWKTKLISTMINIDFVDNVN
ncbi:hypothetical protein GCM10009119_24060 [Algoriphagus jejuensis]|uniref:HNH endonuclease n=1 Tax=Algoriphagus jejuensis TaxID=419934 RepID=A0ABP3YED0_9BACT